MSAFALLFTLSALGISETVYLIRKRVASEKPFCPLNESCTVVLTSKYSKMFSIPNDILGLLFYVAISFTTVFLVLGVEPIIWWDKIAKVLIAGGTLLSIYFIYLQRRVIKAWCFWCLMSAFTIFAMALIVLISNLHGI